MPQHVRDLEALRAGLVSDRLNLVGHSSGAILGLLYAADHPDRVTCVVAANPGPPLDSGLGQRLGTELRRRYRPEDLEDLKAIERSGEFAARDPETVERYFRVMYAPFFDDRDRALGVDYGFTRITADNVVGAEERAFADLEQDPAELVSRITCPTLVVYGRNEPIPVEFARWISETVPNATLEVLEGQNHFGFIEDPEPFFGSVTPFLQRHAVA